MLVEQVEGKWIKAFAETFRLCRTGPGDGADASPVVIEGRLCENLRP